MRHPQPLPIFCWNKELFPHIYSTTMYIVFPGNSVLKEHWNQSCFVPKCHTKTNKYTINQTTHNLTKNSCMMKVLVLFVSFYMQKSKASGELCVWWYCVCCFLFVFLFLLFLSLQQCLSHALCLYTDWRENTQHALDRLEFSCWLSYPIQKKEIRVLLLFHFDMCC